MQILITLNDTVTLEDMESKRASLKTVLKSRANHVLAELSQNALSPGYWNNGLCQMGVYVNKTSLPILAGSKNTLAFTRHVTHAYRIKAANADDGYWWGTE